jgi:hypothetical protein
MFAMVIGSCAGGYAATMFGADAILFASLIGSSVGGVFAYGLRLILPGNRVQ